MSRSISIGAVVLLSAGVAYGDARGEVMSYWVSSTDQAVVIPVVPSGGFVITDIVFLRTYVDEHVFYQDIVGEATCSGTTRARIRPATETRYHFQSGIRFDGGSKVSLCVGFGVPVQAIISGYIPCPDPCGIGAVPAVGNAGVGVMVVLLLAGGALVISRRQRQAA